MKNETKSPVGMLLNYFEELSFKDLFEFVMRGFIAAFQASPPLEVIHTVKMLQVCITLSGAWLESLGAPATCNIDTGHRL